MTSSVRRDVAKSMFAVFQRRQEPQQQAAPAPAVRPAAISGDLPEDVQVKINRRMTDKKPADRKSIYETTSTNRENTKAKKTIKREGKKVSPNDPCPCGKTYPDGKPIKYKNCCGRNR
jgi:preprotein translocase subunit SecA